MPFTFENEGYELRWIESSYGTVNNTANVVYTLNGVSSNGAVSSIATWTHSANNKFAISPVMEKVNTDSKYLYVTASNQDFSAKGFTVTLEFVNNDSDCYDYTDM